MMYFDLQVNGYGGVDFNSHRLRPDDVLTACQKLHADGVEGILATIITDDVAEMKQRMTTICQARQRHPMVKHVVQGFHLEGPFISREQGYVGAHPLEHVLSADISSLRQLLDAGEDLVRIVTLAPECDRQQTMTRELSRRGIVVSAGHCNPSLKQLYAGIDAGLAMFTHLGNACPLQINRHDNIIQRVLALSDQLWIGFIADGVHIPLFALKNYLAVAGLERTFVVTDAISAASQGTGKFQLGEQDVLVDRNLATWSADGKNLVGSACTMPQIEQNLRDHLALNDNDIATLMWHNPRLAIGKAND